MTGNGTAPSRPITRQLLINWGGEQVVHEAEQMVAKGLVAEAEYDPPFIRGAVLWNNRPLRTSLKVLPNGLVESQCPCRANTERGLICAHVIALGLSIVRRMSDPLREEKYQAELRRASRLARIDERAYILRRPAGTPGALPCRLRLTLEPEWQAQYEQDAVALTCEAEYQGERAPIDAVPRGVALTFSRQDDSLLFVIEDICEGPAQGRFTLRRADFLNILDLCGGARLGCRGGEDITVNETRMATRLRMDLDRETGELILMAITELPFLRPGEFPIHMVSGRRGWVYGHGNLWPLQNLLPLPYQALYQQPVIVARPDVLRFIERELPTLSKHTAVESDITAELFTIEPAAPRFRLAVAGSPASLSATLYADYGPIELVAGKPDARENFGIPDPDDLMRYLVRNRPAERHALEVLRSAGLPGDYGDALTDIVGNRNVLNFLGGCLPALRRRGWQIEMRGRVEEQMDTVGYATPVVRIQDDRVGHWFDVSFSFDDNLGQSVSNADVQLALRKGEAFLTRNGRTILIDADAVRSMEDVFADCASADGGEAGHFRMPTVYAPYVKSSLDALDGVDVEADEQWRSEALRHGRALHMESVPLTAAMEQRLRPYQKEGVNWLRFLESSGFCGILADEMGLGKTIQTLAWLELARHTPEAAGKPALIVCPTSLVDNWAEEAERFAPGLKVLRLTGSDRHERRDQVPGADLVVTSYALLRRDIEQLVETQFAVAILDEAQHIKNKSTQNALAAKHVKAFHRLVLTGTPMENAVSDLWSIMDFLMPGYLGTHEAFRQNYEIPISHGGPESDLAQIKLRRKLHPFMLRRLKKDVAKELPPKIAKLSWCTLTPDQKAVYTALLESSRRRLSDMVAKQGFNKCRMEVLKTLMRLRQTCCHLGLLHLPDLNAAAPSAKLEQFLELVDEAIDGGHRILVFSQFVSMLQIIRQELDQRGIAYCYLDGSTRERLEVVHRFNTQRDVPLFLISLKAGGTGLNLTGADMVVHFDPWWNPAVEDQATDRAYRIGQKRTVYSIKLITRGTVEEKVLALQERKKAIIDATVESDEPVLRSLTWEDVQELLTV